jgi:hypothetical protein
VCPVLDAKRVTCSGLPHERGYFRTLGRSTPGDDEEAGDPCEGEEECGTCDDKGGQLTAAQRERRLGCPGCPRRVTRACDGCGGWLGRPTGSNPKCNRQDCPGATDSEGWTIVDRGRHVQLRLPSAQLRREDLKRDEDPNHSAGQNQGGGGGGRSARTRQAQLEG